MVKPNHIVVVIAIHDVCGLKDRFSKVFRHSISRGIKMKNMIIVAIDGYRLDIMMIGQYLDKLMIHRYQRLSWLFQCQLDKNDQSFYASVGGI